jgi:hypothetical protein
MDKSANNIVSGLPDYLKNFIYKDPDLANKTMKMLLSGNYDYLRDEEIIQ